MHLVTGAHGFYGIPRFGSLRLHLRRRLFEASSFTQSHFDELHEASEPTVIPPPLRPSDHVRVMATPPARLVLLVGLYHENQPPFFFLSTRIGS